MMSLVSPESATRVLLDALPFAVFIVDRDGRILDANRAAIEMVGASETVLMRPLCGDLLRCIHAGETDACCGTTRFCPSCAIRQSLDRATNAEPTTRRLAHMFRRISEQIQETWFYVSVAPITLAGQSLFVLVLEDITEMVELRQMVPMCANCRRVRDDNDYWQRVEDYLYKHTALRFTHGLCPECLQALYGEMSQASSSDSQRQDDHL